MSERDDLLNQLDNWLCGRAAIQLRASDAENSALRDEVARLKAESEHRAGAIYELTCVRDELRAKLAAMTEKYDGTLSDFAAIRSELSELQDSTECVIEELKTKLAAAEKDAERYRWLREREDMDIAACWILDDDFDSSNLPGETPVLLDAVIDVAIQSRKEGESHG